MKKNIFEGAKFRDTFITDDNLEAVYLSHGTLYHSLAVKYEDNTVIFIQCNDNGDDFSNREDKHNIISHYQEPIDEEEIDKVACNNIPNGWGDCPEQGYGTGDYEPAEDHSILRECFVEGFKVGYRKAKDE